MGIRRDTFVGLHPDALAFLKEHEVPQEVCECCGHSEPLDLEVIASFHDGIYDVHRHELNNGSSADEFLQAITQSGMGPVFFLGLHRPGDFNIQWSYEEIKEETTIIQKRWL